MSSVSFDALEYLQDLRAGGISQEEAEVFTKATAKAFAKALDDKDLATRNDIVDLEIKLVKSQNDLVLKMLGFMTGIQAFSLALYTFAQHFMNMPN